MSLSTTWNTPATPGNTPGTPENTTATPGNTTATPGNTTEIPGNTTEIPENTTETPGNTTATPLNACLMIHIYFNPQPKAPTQLTEEQIEADFPHYYQADTRETYSCRFVLNDTTPWIQR